MVYGCRRYAKYRVVSHIIRVYNPYSQEPVSDIWVGDYRVKQTSQLGHFAGFEVALHKFQKFFRGGIIIRKRVFKRTALFKEELMAATWHPRRIEKYMSLYGLDVDDL